MTDITNSRPQYIVIDDIIDDPPPPIASLLERAILHEHAAAARQFIGNFVYRSMQNYTDSFMDSNLQHGESVRVPPYALNQPNGWFVVENPTSPIATATENKTATKPATKNALLLSLTDGSHDSIRRFMTDLSLAEYGLRMMADEPAWAQDAERLLSAAAAMRRLHYRCKTVPLAEPPADG